MTHNCKSKQVWKSVMWASMDSVVEMQESWSMFKFESKVHLMLNQEEPICRWSPKADYQRILSWELEGSGWSAVQHYFSTEAFKGLIRVGWGPPILWRAICFTQKSTYFGDMKALKINKHTKYTYFFKQGQQIIKYELELGILNCIPQNTNP